jgi:hypothetical protein
MKNNKQQTEINAVEYLGKVNQFAKENNTDKPKQQTAIEWFGEQVLSLLTFEQRYDLQKVFQQAKQMEKQQIMDAHYAPKYGCFNEEYYKETYGGKDGE